MKKNRNWLIAISSCLGALEIAFIVMFALSVLKLWLFLSLTFITLALLGVCVALIVKVQRKIKVAKLNKLSSNKTSGNYMFDVYNLLGLDPQYNQDGTLKNIYEILQIRPIYDENGNRNYTVYELLGITPVIDENGKEVPQVFVIKNRVGRIARVGLSTEFLTRKLTPEEEEQKIIRETLEQKLKEAETAGDEKKAGAIKTALKDQQKKKPAPSKSKKGAKEVSYKPASAKFKASDVTKPAKASSFATFSDIEKNFKNITKIISVGAEKKEAPGTKKAPVEKKTETPLTVKNQTPAKPQAKANPDKGDGFEFVSFVGTNGGKKPEKNAPKQNGFQFFEPISEQDSQPEL